MPSTTLSPQTPPSSTPHSGQPPMTPLAASMLHGMLMWSNTQQIYHQMMNSAQLSYLDERHRPLASGAAHNTGGVDGYHGGAHARFSMDRREFLERREFIGNYHFVK